MNQAMKEGNIQPIQKEWIQPAGGHNDLLHDSDACTVTRCYVEIPAKVQLVDP